MNTAPSSAPTANDTRREIQRRGQRERDRRPRAVARTPPATAATRMEASGVIGRGVRDMQPSRVRAAIARDCVTATSPPRCRPSACLAAPGARSHATSAMRPRALSRRYEWKRAASECVHQRAAVDARHADAREPPPRERRQVGEPLAFAQRREVRRARRGRARSRRRSTSRAHFERARADRGPIHATTSRAGDAHRGDRRFEHAGGEAAPAGVRDADDGARRDRRTAPAGNRRCARSARRRARA